MGPLGALLLVGGYGAVILGAIGVVANMAMGQWTEAAYCVGLVVGGALGGALGTAILE